VAVDEEEREAIDVKWRPTAMVVEDLVGHLLDGGAPLSRTIDKLRATLKIDVARTPRNSVSRQEGGLAPTMTPLSLSCMLREMFMQEAMYLQLVAVR
jgi:hypothetical protein